MRRDLVLLALLVGVFTGFQLAMENRAATEFFLNVPWQQSTVAFGALFFCFGAAAVFVFRSRFWIRVMLVTAIPVLTQVILQLIVGSDAAYPGLALALAIPYGVLFLLGALLVGGPIIIVRGSRGGAI